MAGTRGPIPNRSDQRRRTNDNGKITKAKGAKTVRRPAVHRNWHPIAKRWYLSLSMSGQVIFFEPSDWAQAYLVAEVMSRMLLASKGISAQLFAALDSSTARLMVTEGDRRRLRIELERESGQVTDPDKDASVTVLASWQNKLGSG